VQVHQAYCVWIDDVLCSSLKAIEVLLLMLNHDGSGRFQTAGDQIPSANGLSSSNIGLSCIY